MDITGSTVNFWTPDEGSGVPLPAMAVASAQRGSVIFDDSGVGADGRFLQGTLANSASGFDFVGEIAHLLIFDSSLSDTDRLLTEGWLAGKV